ncbi:hypothetical protein [Pseudomonas trivialis]|uniref:hypothetical protein n=1 Tax=Pseudomonas trivialis TaxID=200450 RepID=UPI0011875999|nr:hypothetical protein [Pseudomonas trivialis]
MMATWVFSVFIIFMARKFHPNGQGERVVIGLVADIFHLSEQHKKVKTEPKPALFANWGDYRTTVLSIGLKP